MKRYLFVTCSIFLLACSPKTETFYYKNGKIGLLENKTTFINKIYTSRKMYEDSLYSSEYYNNDSIDLLSYIRNELDSVSRNDIYKNGFHITINLKKTNSSEIYDQYLIRLNITKDSIIKSYPVRL